MDDSGDRAAPRPLSPAALGTCEAVFLPGDPAVEDQATDRAYRIGQTQPVQVHRLIAEGTVEDRIAELLKQKKGLADAVLGGEAALTELSDAELAELVTLRRSRS